MFGFSSTAPFVKVSDLVKLCDGLKSEQFGTVGAVLTGKSTVVWEISDVTR